MKTRVKFSKQILSIVLCLAMLMSYVPMTAYAAEPIILSGNTFTTDPGEGFTFQAMYYCGKCKTYSYINNPGAENHSLEITSFNYTISQGKISYSYGYKVNGCEGEATGTFSEKTYTFDCSSDQYKYNTGQSITPTGLSTSQSVSVKFRRDSSAHQGNATCATADNCVLCGTSYKDASNHEKTNEFTYSVNSDPAKHDVKYACCGATKETVAHSLQYSHNGNTITETCSINCGHSATATLAIENDSYAYTGTAITPATITYSDDWQREKPTDISYSNNVNASTEGNPATAKITVNGYELSDTFQITQAIITDENIVLNPESGTYTGTAYEPKISVVWNGATLVEDTHYEVSWDKTGYETPDTYTARVVGIGNFTGSVDKVFTINVADLSDVEVKPTATLTYDGTAQTPTVSASAVAVNKQPITFTYSTEENGTYGNLPSFTNAGTYTVYYKASAPNHEDATGSFTVKIEQKEIGISWGATQFLPYNGESKVPNATATGLVGNDTCTLTTEVVETDDGAGVIPGTWTAKVTALSNPNYKLPESGERVTIQFNVINGYQNDAPVVSGTNETVSGKADGKITGVDGTMEYRKDGEDTYTAISGSEVTGLAAGKYYVRYAAKTYYNPSPDATVVINAGRKLTVTVPQNQVGYTLTVDKTEFDYDDTITINFTFNEGYTPTDDFAVKYNDNPLPLRDNNRVDLSDCTEDIVITVEGVQDTTYPTAEISIKDNQWTEFWNNLTFGLFFNDTQEVTITSADKGSGVNAVYYYLADRELALNEVKAITDWQEYNGTFKIDPDNKYVIYVKVVDNEGNTSYMNSNGIVLDATKPAMYGIENDGVYYGDKVFKALDDYLKTLKVDGVDVTAELNGDNEYKIIADNAEHTVTAIDQAGNVTEYKITVYKNYTVIYKVDGQTVDTQTVGYGKDAVAPTIPAKEGYTQTAPAWDKDGKNITTDTEINAVYTINKYTVTYKADGEVVETVTVEHGKDATAPAIPEKVGYTQTAPVWDKDGKNITADTEINAVYTINEYTVSFKADGTEISTATVKHGEDATLPEIPKKDGFVGKWDKDGKNITDDTVISVVYTEIAEVIPEQVKPDDKTELEDTKKQLEDMLDDDNYTEDDKKEIQDAIDGIDEALEVIENVEKAEELIDKIPENITKNDEAVIKAADEAYNALSDYEKSLVDEDAKKALDDAKAVLAELNKPADTDSPQTGDNSNLWLWFALLFVSGTGIFAITVYDRKRRAASK